MQCCHWDSHKIRKLLFYTIIFRTTFPLLLLLIFNVFEFMFRIFLTTFPNCILGWLSEKYVSNCFPTLLHQTKKLFVILDKFVEATLEWHFSSHIVVHCLSVIEQDWNRKGGGRGWQSKENHYLLFLLVIRTNFYFFLNMLFDEKNNFFNEIKYRKMKKWKIAKML